MRLGIDMDGVLADFNAAYIDLTIRVTGKDLFPSRPFDILTWNYPESYGYTKDEMRSVWAEIKASPVFWQTLKPYPTTKDALMALAWRYRQGDDIYFITARPGIRTKEQTEHWLQANWPTYSVPRFTVLVSDRKDLCVEALNLDRHIDDKPDNVHAIAQIGFPFTTHSCRNYILDRPWNRDFPVGIRIHTLPDMFADLV